MMYKNESQSHTRTHNIHKLVVLVLLAIFVSLNCDSRTLDNAQARRTKEDQIMYNNET